MIRQFFGWQSLPFTKEIPTSQLYQPVSFQECVARLNYMVKTRSFGLVTGEIGAGKSTAIRALKDGLDLTQYRFMYLCDSILKPRDFYRELLHQFGILPQHLRSEAKRQFGHAVWDIYDSQKKTVVIVIDEAHLLQGDMLQEIRFLTNFQIDSVSPLALIIVGQPELRATLKMRLFKPITQRMNIRYHLGGFEPEETKAYVEHQLNVAGTRHPVFTTEAIDAIHAHTRGIAREINNVCTACLLDAVVRKEKLVDTIHVDRILMEYKEI
ncbi:AAA family ATPase [Peptococcaceae bacterium]|nr:AAA family ATPase [Peptococcaceae bacterium]